MSEAYIAQTSSSENIFIGENESKENVYNRLQGVLNTKKLSTIIFNKVSNNKVGYYLIKDNNKYFKIYILPKHISLPINTTMKKEEEAIKDFLHYMQVHIRLQQNYERYRHHEYNIESIIEVGIKQDDAINKIQNIEALTSFKFESILEKIYLFFKTHKSTRRTSIAYTSQTIKHKLDLVKNIKEPNKTKIHQSKYAEFIYSDIANMTYAAIKLFIHKKINLLEEKENKNNLLKKANAIQKLLKQKFKVTSSTRITIPALVGHKTHKYFKKKPSLNQLYSHILMLFGIERFYDEHNNVAIHYSDTIDTFLIQPELLYEWYVYDHLKKSLIADRYRIKLDNVGAPSEDKTFVENIKERTKKIYHFIDPAIQSSERSANPDIIIEDTLEDTLYIVDAKWKRLKTYSKQNHTYSDTNKSISLNDILKLKRDCEVYQDERDIYALLIYCEAEERLIKEHLNDSYSTPKGKLGKSTFSGYIRQIELPTNNQKTIHAFDMKEITEQALSPILSPINSLLQNIDNRKKETYNLLKKNEIPDDIVGNIITDHLTTELKTIQPMVMNEFSISMDDILNHTYCESLKGFLTQYGIYLENTCKSFFHASASSMFYFNKQDNIILDYSLPASGIWKAFEVELNASIVHLIRFNKQICKKESYNIQTNSIDPDFDLYVHTSANGKGLDFMKEDNGILQNIMLGSFKYLMQETITPKHDKKNIMKKSFDKFKIDYDENHDDSLSLINIAKNIEFLTESIRLVRNPYVHQQYMTKNDFDSFMELCFTNNKNKFYFHDLMVLKKQISEYMDRKQPT